MKKPSGRMTGALKTSFLSAHLPAKCRPSTMHEKVVVVHVSTMFVSRFEHVLRVSYACMHHAEVANVSNVQHEGLQMASAAPRKAIFCCFLRKCLSFLFSDPPREEGTADLAEPRSRTHISSQTLPCLCPSAQQPPLHWYHNKRGLLISFGEI